MTNPPSTRIPHAARIAMQMLTKGSVIDCLAEAIAALNGIALEEVEAHHVAMFCNPHLELRGAQPIRCLEATEAAAARKVKTP